MKRRPRPHYSPRWLRRIAWIMRDEGADWREAAAKAKEKV